jgi:hypothetical protein
MVVKGRCDDIERQNLFSRLSEKISLMFYQEMKQEWVEKNSLIFVIGMREEVWPGGGWEFGN